MSTFSYESNLQQLDEEIRYAHAQESHLKRYEEDSRKQILEFRRLGVDSDLCDLPNYTWRTCD